MFKLCLHQVVWDSRNHCLSRCCGAFPVFCLFGLVCFVCLGDFGLFKSCLECVFYRLKTELANLSCVAIKGEKGGCIALHGGQAVNHEGSSWHPKLSHKHPYESCGCTFQILTIDHIWMQFFFIAVNIHSTQVAVFNFCGGYNCGITLSSRQPHYYVLNIFITPERCSAPLRP